MSKPAHKQDDPKKAPGQIVNTGWEKTLGDYVKRKEEIYGVKKKMTFDEWYSLVGFLYKGNQHELRKVWDTAQENV